jgi:hypothetical protein
MTTPYRHPLAIHDDLNIVQAWPEIDSVPVEDLTLTVDCYINELEQTMTRTIEEKGLPYMLSKDAAGLCTILLDRVRFPFPRLLRMCQSIVSPVRGRESAGRRLRNSSA